MGAPIGNKNAAKGRQFRAALERALAEHTERLRAKAVADAKGGPISEALLNRDALQAVASALVTGALIGDLPAIKELADRIDGKVPTLVGEDPDNRFEGASSLPLVGVDAPARD